MSSRGSVTTAPTAGSGLPAHHTRGNKMKLDMPPRPVKSNSRRQTQSQSAAAAGTQQQQQSGVTVKDDGSVPHVVRVTFLGVAGLLAKPPPDRQSSSLSSSSSRGPMNGPASADHPSLLFPLPANMRVVASVSRSRTARGIPSGISKCLTPSGGGGGGGGSGEGGERDEQPLGEKILVEKQPSGVGRNRPPGIEEVSISRSSTIEFEDRDHNIMTGGVAKALHRDPAPPSQLLMHSRTSSSGHRSGRGGSRTSGGTGAGGIGGGASVESGSVASPGSRSSRAKSPLGGPPHAPDEECIEVIRPYSPTAAAEGGGTGARQNKKKKKLMGIVVGGSGGEAAVKDVPPERFVAVWDENSRPAPIRQPGGASGDAAVTATQQQQRQRKQFVNSTSSLAFEAELRPSASSPGTGGEDAGGRASTPVASTAFAPKSFCVTVGLVPDFDGAEGRHRGGQG
eukprot:CAMPEP_0181138596 /NCGR_PEP_ID=MMETSP1071-20121207/34332_1 /TAXON_ID=35127 /ORGANISM="Thalassiosira sp., Strain NH16" /LENGTH=452 /DNA_ID=CAMNT_0023225445 /DNA_START=207 /DNA_END=1563 /DNA_ORIENTATION=+